MKESGKNFQMVFNFSERALYSAIAILIVLIFAVGVYATVASGVTHPAGDITGQLSTS